MKNIKVFYTVLVILFINIALTGFLTITVKRPVIYYEYLFLPVVLIVLRKHYLRTALVMGLILLDLLFNVSHLYYFDVFNYLEKLPSLFISNFSVLFWMGLIVSLILFGMLCNYLVRLFENKINGHEQKSLRLNLLLSVSLFLIVYCIDGLNGSTVFDFGHKEHPKVHFRINSRAPINIGKSLIKDIYTDFNLYETGKKPVSEIPDFKNINNDSSFAYKYFYHSNGKKEVVIVMESWGLLLNDALRNTQLSPFYAIDSNRFKVIFEKSYFDGATVQAESRELLNKEGEAYFSVINHNQCDIVSLVQKKVAKNYQTIAVQSFPGSYSLGSKFKKTIGFQEFKDYSYFHDTLHLRNSWTNHYTSVKDEMVFDYIFDKDAKPQKTFTYCLTINTHLPFALSRKEKSKETFKQFYQNYKGMFPSDQTLERYYRMNQQLSYLAALINKSDVDRVLIIGDHAPPFIFKEERKLFSPNYVPAMIIVKK